MTATPTPSPAPANQPLRSRLDAAHHGLLAVHKTLLDHERMRYEQVRGRIESPGELLNLVLKDPWFEWLRPISMLVAQIDEFTESRQPTDPREGEALLTQARSLLIPGEEGTSFQREYYRAIQQSPEVALAHAQWKRTQL